MNKKSNVTVYVTDEYENFKKLKSNRKVKKSKVTAIKESIKEIGWIPNPIIVNEKLQVIDGQHRLAALEQLGLPVPYVIAEGVGVNECMWLNRNMSNWTIEDYITAYIEEGNEHYKKLRELSKKHKVGCSLIYNGTHNKIARDGGNHYYRNDMRKGEFYFPGGEFEKLDEILTIMKPLIEMKGKHEAVNRVMLSACMWVCKNTNADKHRVVTVVKNNITNAVKSGNADYYITFIHEYYNKRISNGKVNIRGDYEASKL